ncbi:MAG: sensor histidine kinase, partial [Oscillospiraceae bacterium]|nr:sensor histidine kinase [Oscillospiraceae bacterium]
MAKRKITRRWLFNSFGIILLILIAIEIFSAYGLRSYYYSGVEQTVVSRADLVDGLLKKYSQDASSDYATEVRSLIENFEDKDKMEII